MRLCAVLAVALLAGCSTPKVVPPAEHSIRSREEMQQMQTEAKLVQGFANIGALCGFIVHANGGGVEKITITRVNEAGTAVSWTKRRTSAGGIFGCPTAVVE